MQWIVLIVLNRYTICNVISVILTLNVFACVLNHYTHNCFEHDLCAELLCQKSKLRLKADAVPTIFTFSVQPKKRLSSCIREEIAEKRQLLDDRLGSSSSFVSEDLDKWKKSLKMHLFKQILLPNFLCNR